jgi:uncharacterized iron-regulated protein
MHQSISFLLASFGFAVVSFPAAPQKLPIPEMPAAQQQELTSYLKAHWKTPEDYVVDKFATYDLVFIGEYHRIKHDPELIQALIPRLYKAGVRNLGLEFTCSEDQEKVDALLASTAYDENLVRYLFRQYTPWPYVEYMDIYRRAWELNRSLPASAPRFRVVNLGYKPNFRALREGHPEDWRNVWQKGDPDEFMAQVILKEFVAPGRKALIYSGMHHAFTRYHQPIYDFDHAKFIRFNQTRMGNIVHDKVPAKVFTIFLHSPWPTRKSSEESAYPAAGLIDRVMQDLPDKRVGFDVQGSPFGRLRDPNTYYAFGYEDFTLDAYTDGYIFQKAFSDYAGVTTDKDFITAKELPEILENFPNPQARKVLTTPALFLQAMAEDADIPSRFKRLE